ncbi:2-oxo acid dehydrogenase subunit E2 [uncultured Rhodoblastus sp.]|uniref:2-oxo acid dehydrogenase subunit E2 n=1 Tax=uncultured Rhodoblastus sp. TaxID=543037 RepID=UPI0025F2BE62|nr:2-oxo acid dehydrogenase subunit E2 [uncultured Rhodoblastus sp.]
MDNLQPAETFHADRLPGRRPVSPRARRLAREAGCDLAGVAGSGPHGRIVERDVRAALAVWPSPAAALDLSETLSAPAAPLELRETPGAPTAPQAHLETDCNLDALEKWRRRFDDSTGDEAAAKVSLVDCVIKALALALQQTPRANIRRAGRVFAPAAHSAIAMAMAVEGRLATPALAAAESLTLTEIAEAREKFMAGGFAPAPAVAGGFADAGPAASCLVIDFGDFGVKRVFPVLVAPWTLALAIGEAQERVVVEDGAPAVAAILSVTLTIDRRAMDEIAGAMLLDAFRRLIENPHELLF